MEIDQLMQALSECHKEFGVVIRKDSRNNRNTYVSLAGLLEQIHERLSKHGLILTQAPYIFEGNHALFTRLTHPSSKQSVECMSLLTPGPNAQSPDQGWGGSSTYHRRYDAMMICGFFADDDATDNDGVVESPDRESTYIPSRPGIISEKQAKLLGWKIKELSRDDLKGAILQKFGSMENVTIEAFNKLKPDLGLN
jgi:hypothetical protein